MVLMAFCTVNFFFSNMAVSDHYHYYSYMYNRKRSVAEFGRKNNREYELQILFLPPLDRFVYYHLFRAWPCSAIDFD